MTPDSDFLVDNYVIPYRQFVDTRQAIMNKLKKDPDMIKIVQALLNSKGWRERSFAATAVGIFNLEEFVDQIYEQAVNSDNYHEAFDYAFAFSMIDSEKTIFYLKKLSSVEASIPYSKAVRDNYIAGLSIVSRTTTQENISVDVNRLQKKLTFWRQQNK